MFEPRDRSKIKSVAFPQFSLDGNLLEYVPAFKYLRHMISDALSDNDDSKRKIRNMFTRTNILARKFSKCSITVKVKLFKVYCICLYGVGLRLRYKRNLLTNWCRVAINVSNCFHYSRRDSVIHILLNTVLVL